MTDLKQHCIDLEHFETPEWAARAILTKELLTSRVIDPCCGAGALVKALERRGGYHIHAIDIHDWGFDGDWMTGATEIADFLTWQRPALAPNQKPSAYEFSVFMNPPFSKAVEFVEKAFELGARKIVCFQRFSWWESNGRKEFWRKHPPARVYICGDRATTWRHDIPQDQRGSSTPTAHAWFVWEQGQPAGTLMGHIYKEDAA